MADQLLLTTVHVMFNGIDGPHGRGGSGQSKHQYSPIRAFSARRLVLLPPVAPEVDSESPDQTAYAGRSGSSLSTDVSTALSSAA